jgi:hypothetical protein
MSAALAATNDDAALAKLAAVERGYYDDPLLAAVGAALRGAAPRDVDARVASATPLIRRGYYARVRAVRAVAAACEARAAGAPWQLVVLGAGFDTLGLDVVRRSPAARVLELDMPPVAARKAQLVRDAPALRDAARAAVAAGPADGLWTAGRFVVAAADLRRTADVARAVALAGLDVAAPTLFLSECVMIYLPPDDSDALLRWISSSFVRACFCAYEQIGPRDRFGAQMVRSLEARGAPLLGIHKYPDLAAQRGRFRACGFAAAAAADMRLISDRLIDGADRARLVLVDRMDEYEEWDLIQAHYCVVVAAVAAEDGLDGLLPWGASNASYV